MVARTFAEFVAEITVLHSDVALPAFDCAAYWTHAKILAKVCHTRDWELAKTLSVSDFHHYHQLQSYCRMSWAAFVCDLAEGIAFVAAVATRDEVTLKLLPFLSRICPNCSFDLMKVEADMSHTMDDVTLTKEYLNKVDVIDFSGTILYRA